MDNFIRYFQMAMPFLALLMQSLKSNKSEAAMDIAQTTLQFIESIKEKIDALPKDASTVIKGVDGISSFGEQILAQITAIKTTTLEKWQKVEEATKLAAQLSNSKIVFQPKKGDDFEALKDYKAQALNLINEISK